MYRFIVGTGRCGSTLLSKMIRENEQVASIFEYFSGLDPDVCFSRKPVDAETFAALHCNQHTITSMVLARGYPIAEVVYPFDAPGARYSRESGVPFIVGATLASLFRFQFAVGLVRATENAGDRPVHRDTSFRNSQAIDGERDFLDLQRHSTDK